MHILRAVAVGFAVGMVGQHIGLPTWQSVLLAPVTALIVEYTFFNRRTK